MMPLENGGTSLDTLRVRLGRIAFVLAASALLASMTAVGVFLPRALMAPGGIVGGETTSLSCASLAVIATAALVACSLPATKNDTLRRALGRVDFSGLAPAIGTLAAAVAIWIGCFVPLMWYLSTNPDFKGVLLVLAFCTLTTLAGMVVALPFVAERFGLFPVQGSFGSRMKGRLANLGFVMSEFAIGLSFYALILSAIGLGGIFSL